IYTYGKQNWFEYSAQEHHAVRNAVGLFDQSSFGKFVLQGPDAMSVLNQICANDVDVPVGKIVYTQWLNESGGIEADLTVTRQAIDSYLIVTAAATQVRDFAWLRDHIPAEARAIAIDVSSGQAVLSVMGPNSRALLSSLTPDDLSNEAFAFGTSKIIDLAYARVRANRITYVGELGWEIYIPTEFAAGVFDAITAVGRDFGLRHCGYHALNSLRTEKGYRHWGHDVSPDDTPLEAGLGFVVAMNKRDGFIGRDALVKQKDAGLNKRMVQFSLADPERLLYHNEPIWRDGEIVGNITSGMYGHTIDAPLGMGYVTNRSGLVDKTFVTDAKYEIEVAGERVAATAQLDPFYDPKSLRVKS
ncbi:MAG: aminomethyltransferase family protein, partial [Actinomycetota bacterium]